jgi:hypothetical protein
MNTECRRIADQARRAFAGEAWHGQSVKEILENITPEQAAARPIAGGHSIWELALHIAVWTEASSASAHGVPMPDIVGKPEDWPSAGDHSPAAWSKTRDRVLKSGAELAKTIEGFSDERLHDQVPGRKYEFYYLFHGIVQHTLYHAGQIALMKKA